MSLTRVSHFAGADKLRAALLPGAFIGVAAAAMAMARTWAPEQVELALYDVRAAASAARRPASGEVVLVAVDEDTVRLAGGVHPLPRGALAAVVEEARRAGARVIAVDYILQDPLEGALASENAELERALAGGDVVLAVALPPAAATGRAEGAPDPMAAEVRRLHARSLGGTARPERFTLSPPLSRFALPAAALGGVSQQGAQNGRIYALRHLYPTAEGDYLSLPLAVAWLAKGRPPLVLEQGGLRLGDMAIPFGQSGLVHVRWYGAHDGRSGALSTYPELSAATLLRARLAREGAAAPLPPAALEPLRGRIAVVCPTLAGTKDKQPTPANAAAVGAEVVANAIDNFLRGEFVWRLPPWGEAAVALGLSLASAAVVALASARVARPWAAVALSAVGAGALLAGWWYFSMAALVRGVWLPAFTPILGGLLSSFAADLRLFALERRDRRFVHDALGRYTSPALVRTLLAHRELLDRLGGTRQDLTVHFSDIRGFTSFAEHMNPERMVEFLNVYLSTLTEIIERHGGYVDKYIGDAIMSVWGAPVPAVDHALRACAAALQMRDRVEALRPAWQARYGCEIFIGAGINTGPMVAGNVGSRRKTNYTVLGDSVNLASRLEGANKVYGTAILLGEGTYRAAREGIAARSIDALQVKGRKQGALVYELVGLAGELSAPEEERLARWEQAVAAYRRGRFAEALQGFEEVLRLAPQDGPAVLYATRCRDLLVEPPPPGWDGVHVLHDK
ncbi:MAG: hypothetical protein A2V77_10690 [Anaeromyxobacter sp. RBG_16_69_14]|nr:MAG: hypothetical protein A2V77_10690 [Anaeromyxobacter sp. RBG_16_69_14]